MSMIRQGAFSVVLAAFAACGGGKQAAPAAEPAAPATPAEPAPAEPVVPKAETRLEEPPPAPPPILPTMTVAKAGLATPESVLYDAINDVYLVSNINGGPGEKDQNGFISRIGPDGTVLALKWIDGANKATPLHAPKGMAVAGGLLYVADIDAVRVFELATGKAKAPIVLKGATFVNDVAAGPDGTIYVSDSGIAITDKGITPTKTDAIWAIKKGKAAILIKGEELGRPNGLFATENGVWACTFGTGEVYFVDSKGVRGQVMKVAGALDGIHIDGDKIWTTSWEQNAIMVSTIGGTTRMALGGLAAPADFAYDTKRDLLVVPLFNDNKVLAHHRL